MWKDIEELEDEWNEALSELEDCYPDERDAILAEIDDLEEEMTHAYDVL